jgi:adenine-specific DNA-methyltransferase
MPTLQFKGKALVQNHHLVVPFSELIPVKSLGLSKTPSLHDNLIVEGDNLKALKALLPTYHGKVKCIYIDPPYNTGKEGWIYNDKVNSPMIRDWLGKTVDRDDLTRHDKWCCMMLPRLKLLREFLGNDGVLFASLDDNEISHLRCLLDEVFGEDNFVGTIIWKNVTDNNPTNISVEHEYIVCYAKSKDQLEKVWQADTLAVKERLVAVGQAFIKKHPNPEMRQSAYTEWFRENKGQLWPLDRYKYIDDGGIYTGSQSVHNPGREGYRYDVLHPITKKPCKEPLMGYRFPRETMDELLKTGRILFGDDEDKIIELKLYAQEYRAKLSSLIELDTRIGAYELKEVFTERKKTFDYAKPSELIRDLVAFSTRPDSIVLDSFAGSGTTGHAVLAQNEEDGGQRRFILCQMPYETAEQQRSGENICKDVTAERIRRIARGLPQSKNAKLRNGLGGSFSYFKLGQELQKQGILDGNNLPGYEALAGYVFFTATGDEFQPKKLKRSQHYIGTSREKDVFLIYEDDLEKLKDMALNLELARKIAAFSERPKLVFGPTKYHDQDYLDRLRIEFCQLPFEIYQRAQEK